MEVRKIKRKVLLLGDGAVGKTSLIRKYVMDRFDDKYITTIGTKVTKKVLEMKPQNAELTLMIWDVLGQKGYSSIQSSSYKGSEGALVVCDLTRKETLKSLEEYWCPNLSQVAGNVPLVLVGNKCDLKDQFQVSEGELKAFATKFGAPYFRCSAKTGENVEAAFGALGESVCRAEARPEAGQGSTQAAEIKTLIDATDFIISDFCKGYNDEETAMAIVRQQFGRAGVDINAPTKAGVLKAIEYLAEAEKGVKTEHEARARMVKRRLVVEKVEG
ncbi:MAG: GTP-binding protein [Euryarchaeota archaeon]|nr:GTP-binding protein [Euryarchaeota archaeon]